MDLGLKDKVAVVTAASKGLGAATARRLAEEGAKVVVVARNEERLKSLAQSIGALPLVADVARPDAAASIAQAALDRFGRLDILILNAGGPPSGKFLDLDAGHWEAAVQLTLMSAVRLCYAVVPHLLKNEPGAGGPGIRGAIAAITSISVKQPLDNLLLSNSIRMAVVGLIKTLANELGPQGIRFNSIVPGWTATERVEELLAARSKANHSSVEVERTKITDSIPLGRMGKPDEFADALAWLVSPRASYVHGTLLLVDGGIVKTAL